MEELREINFQAILEGQDYEKHLKKIVSTAVSSTLEHVALFLLKTDAFEHAFFFYFYHRVFRPSTSPYLRFCW